MNRQDLHSYALRVIDAVVHLEYKWTTALNIWSGEQFACPVLFQSLYLGAENEQRSISVDFFLYDWRLFVVMASWAGKVTYL